MNRFIHFEHPFRILLLAVIIILLKSQFLLAQQPAFPGAEGWGRYTQGGRGGEVYEVTNLNDRGVGSLRYGIEKSGPRTIVFRISGTIRLLSDLKIKQPYVTIAGQTAPGDGICLRDYPLEVTTNQVIIRYLRFRLGDESGRESDSFWGRERKNIMIDHCSASWSVDEALSFYGNDSLTVQWCLISESLYMSVHSKGAHGYGGIWGGNNASFHHNLLAHHSSRNPRFSGGVTSACVNVDFRNNVIYNWGFNSAYGGEGGTINMVANYFKSGPATKSNVKFRIVEPYDKNGQWYIADNFVEGAASISADNWAGGVQGSNAISGQIRAFLPFPFDTVTTHSAQKAFELILVHVGANLPKRDSVDERIIYDVRTGSATYDGHFYEKDHGFSDTTVVRGIIDSQVDVGGWPDLSSAPAPEDTDHDGMPNDWELHQGLNPNDPSDRNLVTPDGYTMLEKYLNSLIPPFNTGIQTATLNPSRFTLEQNYPNPFNQQTTISYSIPNAGKVNLKIYTVTGTVIRNLYSNPQIPGAYKIQWDGLDDQMRPIASGIYFCVLNLTDQRKAIKLSLVR